MARKYLLRRSAWGIALCLAWLLGMGGEGGRAALAWDAPLETALVVRSLGWSGLREPASFTPSAAFVPQYGGWTRKWTERRVYAEALWHFYETAHLVLTAGGHIGTSTGLFEARNVGIGYYESWETRPALLWGPTVRTLWRQHAGGGTFLRLEYALFIANAPEARESVSSRSGTATPTSSRDAVFAWTSQEITSLVGYDWGRVAVSAGTTLTFFRLDKRLDHHIGPAGASGNALAAILALNAFPSRYGYEPRTIVAPCLSLAFRPTSRLTFEALARPGDTIDATLRLAYSF